MDTMSLKTLLFFFLILTVESHNDGRCSTTEKFDEIFARNVQVAFNTTKEEVNKMEKEEIEERWYNAAFFMSKECGMVNDGKIFDKEKSIEALDLIYQLNPEDKESISLCYQGCFTIYKSTQQEFKSMSDCLRNARDTICKVPKTEDQPIQETEHENKRPQQGKSRCKIPGYKYLAAFECLFKDGSEDSLSSVEVNSFFESIETDKKSKEKLLKDSTDCMADKQDSVPSKMMCLTTAYTETCEKQKEKQKTEKIKNKVNKIKNKKHGHLNILHGKPHIRVAKPKDNQEHGV